MGMRTHGMGTMGTQHWCCDIGEGRMVVAIRAEREGLGGEFETIVKHVIRTFPCRP